MASTDRAAWCFFRAFFHGACSYNERMSDSTYKCDFTEIFSSILQCLGAVPPESGQGFVSYVCVYICTGQVIVKDQTFQEPRVQLTGLYTTNYTQLIYIIGGLYSLSATT